MEPIVLNELGETLLEYPESKTADDKRIIRFIDGRIIGDCIGVHDLCRGWVDIKPVSKTHNALVCRNCSLRIVVSVEVDTYGKLRQWCADRRREQRYLKLRTEATWGNVSFELKQKFHENFKRLYPAEQGVQGAAQGAQEKLRDVQRDALIELDDARLDLS